MYSKYDSNKSFKKEIKKQKSFIVEPSKEDTMYAMSNKKWQSTGSFKVNIRCSCYSCANVRDIIWEEFSQTKVSNFWVKVLVQKYITSFDVSMHNTWHKFFMKVCKTSSNTQANSRSFFPVQFNICSCWTCKHKKNNSHFQFLLLYDLKFTSHIKTSVGFTQQCTIEAVIFYIFINQYPVRSFNTAPNQLNKVWMPDI